jgi:hypothetical protein
LYFSGIVGLQNIRRFCSEKRWMTSNGIRIFSQSFLCLNSYESLANDLANTLDDAAFQYGPAVGGMTHEDGSVTVAISGSPTAMKNARNHLEPRLQTLQEGGEITGYRFGPETPESDRTPLQFTTSPDGRRRISPTCAEPRLGEAARGHDSPPDGMAVVWRPVGAKDKNNPIGIKLRI